MAHNLDGPKPTCARALLAWLLNMVGIPENRFPALHSPLLLSEAVCSQIGSDGVVIQLQLHHSVVGCFVLQHALDLQQAELRASASHHVWQIMGCVVRVGPPTVTAVPGAQTIGTLREMGCTAGGLVLLPVEVMLGHGVLALEQAVARLNGSVAQPWFSACEMAQILRKGAPNMPSPQRMDQLRGVVGRTSGSGNYDTDRAIWTMLVSTPDHLHVCLARELVRCKQSAILRWMPQRQRALLLLLLQASRG